MRRDRTVWVILLILSMLSVGIMAFKVYPLNKKWTSAKERAEQIQFGTDEELEQVIEFLETRLLNRSEYQFTLTEEPMRLTNVLYLTDAYGRAIRYRKSGKLRVTAIIDGNTQRAIVNYRDKNFVVTVGDSVANGEVVWIDSEEVVIISDNKEIHYQVSGLSVKEDVTSKNRQRREY